MTTAEPETKSRCVDPHGGVHGGSSRTSPVQDRDARVAFVSLSSPFAVGGLAAYGRALASQLAEHAGIKGLFITLGSATVPLSDEAALAWPVRTLPCGAAWRQLRRLLMCRLASRPWGHGLLERVAALVVSPSALARRYRSLEVIHYLGTGWDFLGFPLLKTARRLGARFTVWPAVHPGSWGDDQIDLRLYRHADAVFHQSDHEKRHLVERGLPSDKLVPCGLPPLCRTEGDGARFRAARDLRDRPLVLFIGRRDEGKGYPALLTAWRQVVQEHRDAVLVLAGPGGADHQHLLESLPARSVRDLGIPGEAEKADALAASDVFCLPSAHESFGIVYVEAWSYGRPVVCGTAPACRELLGDQERGLWSDGTPGSIAHQISALLRLPALRAQLGLAGQQKVRRDFTRERMAAAHLRAWGMTPGVRPS